MVQTLLIILAGLCLGGCDRETNAPETLDHHVWVDLTDTWDNTPWEPKRDERGVRLPQPEHVRIATTFNLPPDLIGHGSILNLYGLSWTAKVSVNGISLDTITGGPGRTEVDLGSKLRAGKNTIELDITGAKDTPALLVGHSDKEAKVVFPPQLLLRPRVGLDHVVASLTQSGLRLQATTRHAPNGTQVHFEGWRDGEQFADWGNALVHNDQAILDAGEWSGPLWPGDPGESPLFMLKATLISDQGVVLDSGSWRTGLRRFEVSNNHTQLNGKITGCWG